MTDTQGDHGGELAEYRRRRDTDRSGEPAAGSGDRPAWAGQDPVFVVQRHDASTLHFDVRLEIDGVLVSWAVPQGPSLDPREKRLATRTEDHPLAYGDFEGRIEEGYGAGTVIVWDRGPLSSTTPSRITACSAPRATCGRIRADSRTAPTTPKVHATSTTPERLTVPRVVIPSRYPSRTGPDADLAEPV